MTGNLGSLDTGFRPALRRMLAERRLRDYAAPVDWDIDLARLLPALRHTAADAGRYITAGIVLLRDPKTASYQRLQLRGGNLAAIKPGLAELLV